MKAQITNPSKRKLIHKEISLNVSQLPSKGKPLSIPAKTDQNFQTSQDKDVKDFGSVKVQFVEEVNYNNLIPSSPPVSQEKEALLMSGKAKQDQRILHSDRFLTVGEVDFRFVLHCLAETRSKGIAVLNQDGRILWCDKTAHQLLQGSLNNFSNTSITSLLLKCELDRYLQELKKVNGSKTWTTFDWIIYSKNLKRRYKNQSLTKITSQELFLRFLKALNVRILPIMISLPSYRDPNGFCNEDLVPTVQPRECFLLEIQLSKNPNIKNIPIIDDPIIKKFIKSSNSNQSKRSKARFQTQEQRDHSNAKGLKRFVKEQ